MKKIAGVTLEQVQRDAKWVAKMNYGARFVGTYDEVGRYTEDEDCRDFDLCGVQPENLRKFMEKMEEIDRTHGWMTLPEMFERFGK